MKTEPSIVAGLLDSIEAAEADRLAADVPTLVAEHRAGTDRTAELRKAFLWLVFERPVWQLAAAWIGMAKAVERLQRNQQTNIEKYVRSTIAEVIKQFAVADSPHLYPKRSTNATRRRNGLPPYPPLYKAGYIVSDDDGTLEPGEVPHPAVFDAEYDDTIAKTPFERDVLELWADGWSALKIAGVLTVSKYRIQKTLALMKERAINAYGKPQAAYHARLYWENGPKAYTRKQHIANCLTAFRWLSEQVGGLAEVADAVGVVAWIHHDKRGERGFELIKRSTRFLAEWSLTVSGDHDFAALERGTEKHPHTPKHESLIKALQERGWGEWKDGMLATHTYNLLLAAEDKQLDIAGSFSTLATGKDGRGDRNCFCFPDANGSWKIYRFGKGVKETSTWWKTSGGYTATWFNRGKEAKADPAAEIRLPRLRVNRALGICGRLQFCRAAKYATVNQPPALGYVMETRLRARDENTRFRTRVHSGGAPGWLPSRHL